MYVEKTIIDNLFLNDEYSRKVVPFLQEDYFSDRVERKIFTLVRDFVIKYNSLPTKEAIIISFEKEKDITEEEYKKGCEIISSVQVKEPNEEWLLEETEKFCKDKAVYNAIMESIHIIDGKSKEKIYY